MNTTKEEFKVDPDKVIRTCPQCSRPLSAWERVLLSVDRALICKGCWYRILLNPYEEEKKPDSKPPL